MNKPQKQLPDNGSCIKTLHLLLRKVWFDLTAAGIKKEDYRSITGYWVRRLMDYPKGVNPDLIARSLNRGIPLGMVKSFYECDFKNFEVTVITSGYASGNDHKRRREYVNAGISVGPGNSAWGAEAGTLYFVIKHGEKVINQ